LSYVPTDWAKCWKFISGAKFLDESKGEEFIEKLWTEIVADFKAVDPELEIAVQ
jgi:hypothetical protein